MIKKPLKSQLPHLSKPSLTSEWKRISKAVDLILDGSSEKVRFNDYNPMILTLCSFGRAKELIIKIQEKFDNYFKDFLTSHLSAYDKESQDVNELAKEYILKTGSIMPHFEKVVNDISLFFFRVQTFKGSFSFREMFHKDFIQMLDKCDCYDYIFFSISKLFNVFLNKFQIDTFFEEPLFQSVYSTKYLISFASPEKLQTFQELLLHQTQTYFANFISDSYQQLIPPPPLSDKSDDENQESYISIFSGISHKIADNKEDFDPVPHIVSYCDESLRLVELEYQMTIKLFDIDLASKIKEESLSMLSDMETETMQFCLSQSNLFLKNRNYEGFEKLFIISKQNAEAITALSKHVCDQISKEPKSIEELPEVIEFYSKINKELFFPEKKETSENIRKSLSNLVNSDSEGLLKGLLKTINTAALSDANIKSILPIISFFQMKSEFELMHLRHVARRLTQNRNDQIDNEIEILQQLETVKPQLQLDSLRSLINDAERSLRNNLYGPVLLLNSTSWPYKPPYPSPIALSQITVKINDEYIKNNPNRELHFPINYWIVNVKDTKTGTIYNGTGVQAEVLLYFNNHKVITSTALEPRINESFLSAALKAMSSKATPALVSNDNAYSLNENWKHDKIVKLKHPNYKDEFQAAKNADKSKGEMIEACAVKRMKQVRISKFSELDEYIKSELSSKVPISTDEIRKHIDLLINRNYLEEMGSGRLAYVS